jgi:hypothetical protein
MEVIPVAKKTRLTVVRSEPTATQPPYTLGRHGRSLWDRVQAEYDVTDAGGIEMLAQACAGVDIATKLQEEIERDGAVIRVRGSVRAHPAVKDLIATRAFIVRTLIKLGLNFEPVKSSAGRPGAEIGWRP